MIRNIKLLQPLNIFIGPCPRQGVHGPVAERPYRPSDRAEAVVMLASLIYPQPHWFRLRRKKKALMKVLPGRAGSQRGENSARSSFAWGPSVPKSDGWFRPGTSGNPGGRPANHGQLRQHARDYAGDVIFQLVKQTRDPRIPARDRRAAAKLIIRLGFGPGSGIGAGVLKELGWEGVRAALEDQAVRDEREHGSVSRRQLESPADHIERYRRRIHGGHGGKPYPFARPPSRARALKSEI